MKFGYIVLILCAFFVVSAAASEQSVTATAAAPASGHWARQCGPNGCARVWAADAPTGSADPAAATTGKTGVKARGPLRATAARVVDNRRDRREAGRERRRARRSNR